MSAFMVSKTHIDALVTAGVTNYGGSYPLRWYHPEITDDDMPGDWESKTHELHHETADAVGLMLWAANLESINYRYPDTIDEPENMPGPIGLNLETIAGYRYEACPGAVNPVVILKAISCYEYQSCEHPGWKTSEAHAFCEELRDAMITRLAGYNQAPWEISDRHIFWQHVA